MADQQDAQDKQVEMWKVKKLIKSLQAARGYLIFSLSNAFCCGIV
jgi:peptide subunit release factor 1 (eRF1)